jgi:hypothetical protein
MQGGGERGCESARLTLMGLFHAGNAIWITHHLKQVQCVELQEDRIFLVSLSL